MPLYLFFLGLATCRKHLDFISSSQGRWFLPYLTVLWKIPFIYTQLPTKPSITKAEAFFLETNVAQT